MSDRLSFTAASSSDRVWTWTRTDMHISLGAGRTLATFWRGAGSSRLPRLMVVLAGEDAQRFGCTLLSRLLTGPSSESAPVPTHNPFPTAALPPSPSILTSL